MVDVLLSSPDFRPPERGGVPVWLHLEAQGGGHAVVIVARPAADGELWVVANRHLSYHSYLRQAFSRVNVVASTPKYSVLRAVR